MYDALEENTQDKIYIRISDTTNGERNLVENKMIFYFSENGWERGIIQRKTEMNRRKKYLAKEMRSYILVSHIIYGETWLHDLRGFGVSYHSDTPFELLDYGYTTECRLWMIFVTWCRVKLYCHVNLCSTCHILVVYNDISHLGIKVISWIWVIGDVTKIPNFLITYK